MCLLYCEIMLKVAITGNISSGKSAVKNILDELHYKTLCLDEVTEFLYNNSAALKSKLKNEFNSDNKSEIAKFIFDDNKKLKTLENIIYPFIKDEMFAFFSENNKEKIIFVVAPMLFESGFNKYFDKIIFVSSDVNIRLDRLIKRNNYSKSYALKRINSQFPESEKIKKADYVIENNSDLDTLYKNTIKTIKCLNTLL